MRHHNHNRKFGRIKSQRAALLRSLTRSLVEKGRIRTTEAKAKEVRPLIEKMVTKARTGTLANRRILMAALGDARMANKLISTAKEYEGRAGGYTRITKLGVRKGDAAAMALIEFV
ncbi:50S ribosomal protein L17 [Candidatus Adlerbacteria bacterium RIFCSPHIGHO2_02_FULL_52_17]|uniref:50S ribosomal protein L17 n=1 Tax=Candidatus Adlerbacteria bacterium RIFCSPHIGHO2_02_FULL_52_17 TaxID=1797240 RepID=A0A1F4XQ69_9BACT|nr:MAG: 50S ribosomal protein L17 [Candidatus Adlerbacteria bacterium RIFCSPHIGHO2_02_FULL_52_17]